MKEILYFIILLSFVFFRQKKFQDPYLACAIVRLQKIQLDFIAETACLFEDNLESSSTNQEKDLILKTLKEGLFLGVLSHSSIGGTLDCLLKGKLTFEQNAKIQNIFSFRCLLIMSMALLGRFIFFDFYKNVSSMNDLLYLVLSLGINVLSLLFIEAYTPKSWFWHKSLSVEGQAWITSLILGTTPSCGSFAKSFQMIEEKMKYGYFSFRDEKNILLNVWKNKNEREEKNMYQKFSSLSPLIELFGFGSSATLILWVPLNLGGISSLG